jgi:RNA polymerase sigma-70 factor, ECF subfamily
MIQKSPRGHCSCVTETPPAAAPCSEQLSRLKQLVEQYVHFVWRSLRSLGVREADCDDGSQQVWCVVARKLDRVEPGRERSYIFSVTLRVASDMRRADRSRMSLPLEGEIMSLDPPVEELCDQRRAQDLVQRLLKGMPWEQRTAFVMYELEELTLQEIADVLGVPKGTVASRLRLAREFFNAALIRYQARQRHRQRRLGKGSPRAVNRGSAA